MHIQSDESEKKQDVVQNQENSTAKGQEKKCYECGGSHLLANCDVFQNRLDCQQRWSKVKSLRLCFSCLRKGHNTSQCRLKRICGINRCIKNHHKLLHDIQQQPLQSQPTTQEPRPVLSCAKPSSEFLFKVVPLTVMGPKGQLKIFALIDDGSSVSMLDANVAQQLGLKGKKQSLTLQWYDEEVVTQEATIVKVNVKNKDDECFEIKNIYTVYNLRLPMQSFDKSQFHHLNLLPLENYDEVRPLMLLGINCTNLTASSALVSAGASDPVAVSTKLGWVAYGPTCQGVTNAPTVLLISQKPSIKTLNQAVADYFNTENFGIEITLPFLKSEEEQIAERILRDTTRRIEGRYEVGLLWKKYPPSLPDSYNMALKRLKSIESKMKNDEKFAARYKAEINKYLAKSYARKLLQEEQQLLKQPVWYLPHFAVTSPHKPEKLRVVFDAAAIVDQQSLNSTLIKGPEQAKPLMGVLMKFRQGSVAVAADIKEMFCQVKIREADQHAQRFLWRNGDEYEPVEEYVMTTMIFGAICSPCCAEHVKNFNAEQFRTDYPEASNAIIENFYVDDFVCSFKNETEATQICHQVNEINKYAGFELRNFSSNSLKLQNAMNDNSLSETVQLDHDKTPKILGMFWNVRQDVFQFLTKFYKIDKNVIECQRPPTKRELLGIAMAIFDPFGMLADFVLFIKVLLQETWKLKLDWDDLLPIELSKKWFFWWNEFKQINQLFVPRCYSPNFYSTNDIQLHVFMDASQIAFSAVTYIRIKHQNEVHIAFIMGKTRTAPNKLMSIPRLELQGAVLATRIARAVVKHHGVKFDQVWFWTDSKTILNWINCSHRRYNQFVGHRIAEILNSTEESQWRWVPSDENPADAATRVKGLPKIDRGKIWLTGPAFLKQNDDDWPTAPFLLHTDTPLEEVKPTFLLQLQASNCLVDFKRFSSYFRLKRSVAWVLRAVSCFKNNKRLPTKQVCADVNLVPPLLTDECNTAEKFIVKLVQGQSLAEEKDLLSRQMPVPKKSKIYQLTPYLDEDLIRASGRIDEALYLPVDVRRPIIMPKNHYVSELIVKHYHNAYHHQNNAVIINEVRQKFWVIGIKQLLKSVQRSCMSCRIDNAKPRPPLMGQLPSDRVTPYVRPFSYTGVDLFGPLQVTIGRRREKRWAAIFTCLTVRAVHLEIVENLSTDAFLRCFHNFVNRRGRPTRMRSDNGTNFIGAQKELCSTNRKIDTDVIQNEATQLGIDWVFNCPLNPSAGGCWERLIRVVKRLLLKTIKDEAPHLETLRSALIEAENIVNSRPLTDVPLLHSEDEPLTPNHFLIGCANGTPTPYNNVIPIRLRKQWNILQNLNSRLWKQWTTEFLPQLLRRPKWFKNIEPLKKDDIVIVCDNTIPRGQWLKGIVVEVYPSKTGQVRSAKVKTKNGYLTRPATKLAAIVIGESPPDSRVGGMLEEKTDKFTTLGIDYSFVTNRQK